MPKRLYLVKIICLGCVYYEVCPAAGSCDAIVDALARYPQACAVSARRVAP